MGGRTHEAAPRSLGGVVYPDDGDWVENCAAMVEHFDGAMELRAWSKGLAPAPAVAALRDVTQS